MTKRSSSERRPGREGLRLGREGDLAAVRGDRNAARESYRGAIENLVAAFLEDRQANAGLFVTAHRVGEALENIRGCTLDVNETNGTTVNRCAIQALHSRMGMSPAWITRSVCSICGAGDLRCEHIPGQTYDGEPCFRGVTEIVDVDHFALTQNPDFTSTFLLAPTHRLEEIEERVGTQWQPGMKIYSHHCQQCYGRFESRADDIDRTLWERPDESEEPGSEH